MKQIAAVVLAAGASTRFGECKQLLDWDGKPLLAHVTDMALEAGLHPVVPVLGCQAAKTSAVLADRPVRTLMNWRWKEGLATSVQTGLAGVPCDAQAVLFLQCDQPLVTTELLRAILHRFHQTGSPIVHPTHAGRRGTPVLFARRFFAELSTITGDQGGRTLIDRYPDQVATFQVSDPEVLADVDTPQDYRRLRKASGNRQQGESQSQIQVLQGIHHLIVDMDGVLWRGDKAMGGLKPFFSFLRRQEMPFILATNNSTRTPDQYVNKLAGFGVRVSVEKILTSSLVSAATLADIAPSGSRVFVIGEEGVRQALRDQGFILNGEQAEYVVVGWDRDLSWEKLATASVLIHGGAGFLGTNPDVTFPTERGPLPGNGALLAALEASTGVEPLITGKPAPRMYEEALRRMDATPDTTAMIGDRLDTDIAGASRAGLKTILVLSGISTEEDLASSPVKPDVVCSDIHELVATWEQLDR